MWPLRVARIVMASRWEDTPCSGARWRHLMCASLESEIVCSLPRGQCKECQKVYTVHSALEGRSRGLTQDLRHSR